MAKVEDIVREVSDLLNDNEPGCENVRWSKSSIRHWLLEGYLLAAAVAVHKNSELIEVPLVEGSVQSLPDGYEQFVRIVNNPGTLEKIIDSAEKKAKDRFAGIYETEDCVDCVTEVGGKTLGVKKTSETDYEVTGWEAEPMSATTFYVEPPVPKGYTGSVKVLAIKTIDLTAKEADIPMWAHALSIDWALHRAYATDSESQYAMEKSTSHRRGFYELLALFRPPQMGATAQRVAQIGAQQ